MLALHRLSGLPKTSIVSIARGPVVQDFDWGQA